jgi:cobalt-zinc-cadmium efflux system outer membrane protein
LPAAWRRRNDLKTAMQAAYNKQKSVTLAKTQRIPDPYIGINYLFSAYKSQQPRYFDPNGTGFASAGNRVPQQPGYMLTYSQEQPIFYHYQGQVEQAKAQWLQQLRQNDILAAQIANDIVVSYEALIVTRQNIEKFQTELLPAALKVAHLSHRGYELGKMDLATAVLAQQQYQQLRSSYFDSVVAYQNAWADLERAVGLPLNLQ